MSRSLKTFGLVILSAVTLCGCTTQNAENSVNGGSGDYPSMLDSVQDTVETVEHPHQTDEESYEKEGIEDKTDSIDDDEFVNMIGEINGLDLSDSHTNESLIYMYEGEKYIFYDALGNQIGDTDYDNFDSWPISNSTCYVVYKYDNSPNSAGLIDGKKGEIILDCETAMIDKPWYCDRYLIVSYATQEVTDRSECFIYSTSSWISIEPDENDVMYAGYSQVYDLKNRQFVGDIIVTTPGYSFYEIGDSIYFGNWNEWYLYNDEGELISDKKFDTSLAGAGLLMEQQNESYLVYDGDLNNIFTLNFKPCSALKYNDKIIFVIEDFLADGKSYYYLADENGNRMGDAQFAGFPYIEAGLIYGYTVDNRKFYTVSDLGGNTLIDVNDEVTFVDTRADCCMVCIKNGDYKFIDIVCPDGTVIRNLNVKGTNPGIYYEDENGDTHIFLYKNKEFVNFGQVTLSDVKNDCFVILEEGNLKNIYSLMDGSLQIDNVSYCVSTGNYLYTRTSEYKWIIYELLSTD